MPENSTKRKVIGGAVSAAALMIAIPFVTTREGERLDAYEDVVGVYTICNGETLGVKIGDHKTAEQCAAMTRSRVGQFMAQVAAKLKTPVGPSTLAAHTSFAYNIGIAGYARSSTLALTNQGKIADGCRAMLKWVTAGGKDCSVKKNNCYGLFVRRTDEVQLCLAGINEVAP